MTENEKKNLEMEVLAGETVPPNFEIDYIKVLLAQHKAEVWKIQINFAMFKDVNDFEGLEKCKPEIKRLRDRIAFFEKRLDELGFKA